MQHLQIKTIVCRLDSNSTMLLLLPDPRSRKIRIFVAFLVHTSSTSNSFGNCVSFHHDHSEHTRYCSHSHRSHSDMIADSYNSFKFRACTSGTPCSRPATGPHNPCGNNANMVRFALRPLRVGASRPLDLPRKSPPYRSCRRHYPSYRRFSVSANDPAWSESVEATD